MFPLYDPYNMNTEQSEYQIGTHDLNTRDPPANTKWTKIKLLLMYFQEYKFPNFPCGTR